MPEAENLRSPQERSCASMRLTTNKQKIFAALNVLPDDVPIDEAVELLCVLGKVEKSREQRAAEEASKFSRCKTPKQRALWAISTLPDDVSSEEIVERVLFFVEIERGLLCLKGRADVTEDEMKRRYGL